MSLVGEKIAAWCLKCKLELTHVVLYEQGNRVGKVRCLTCGAEHLYRGPKPDRKVRSSPAGGRHRPNRSVPVPEKNKAVREADSRWVLKKGEIGPDLPIQEYNLKSRYACGDVVDHPLFGLGFVERIVTDSRMDVLFRDGLKTMGMNKCTA
jgi:hypothetical protein